MQNNNKLRIIDLFCGLGAFRIGFEENGFKTVFSSDFNKNVQKVYERNFNEKPFGDITNLNPSLIPDFDVLLAGFPCQPFSISGKNLGFKDTRGTLFFNICQIIKEKKPKVVLLENVKNIIYHDKKRTIKVIINSLLELGYKVEWKVLNLIDFGLPQNRERIFFVASKDFNFNFNKLNKTKSLPLRDFLDKENNEIYLEEDEYTLIPNELINKQKKTGLMFVGYRNKQGFKRGIRPNTEHLSRVHRQPNRIYSIDGYHPTIPSQESNGRFYIFIPELNKVRKLSIRECFRIMGFPENYKLDFARGTHTVQIGNSCGVSVIKELSYQIKKQLLDVRDLREKINKNYKSLQSVNGQTRLSFS